MLIRHSELDIPENDPFLNDALGRKELEPPLTQFITQAYSPFTLALDSSWGTGKTTFLNMWQVKLKKAEHVCLYLNAWKNDFMEEPLVAIVGELSQAIKDIKTENIKTETGKSALQENMNKVKKAAGAIAKRAIPALIKLATNGVLNFDAVNEKIVADFTGNITEDLIHEYKEGKDEIKEFREALEALAFEVKKQHEDAKIVIIIDELDRCRPTYAVQLLERIKHLFDVPEVVFILGIDRSQLNHSIKSLYGAEFDAVGYLRRFIDLDYQLPEPKSGDYCSYLFKRFGIEDLVLKRRHHKLPELRSYLGMLMSAARMSLREQEQTISRLRVVLQTISTNDRLYELALAILLFLREWKPNIYNSFIDGKSNVDEIISLIEDLPNFNESIDKVCGISPEYFEAYLLAQGYHFSKLNNLKFMSSRYSKYEKLISDSNDLEVPKANDILNTVNKLTAYGNRSEFKITANRLALTNQFISY